MNAFDQAAAEWLARQEQGMSPSEQRAFIQWLDADEHHARSFREMKQAWGRLDQVRIAPAAIRFEAELTEHLAGRGGDNPGGGWLTWRRAWPPAAIAASLIVGVALFLSWQSFRLNGRYTDTAATDIGVVQKIELPDGSIVRLNTNTSIEVLFTETERRLRLGRGEALFSVAKSASRPFVVNVGEVDVRAIGTEFNVRIHSRAVEVTVREGKVRVDDAVNGSSLLAQAPAVAEVHPPAAALLAAGQRVLIPVDSEANPKASASMVAPIVVAPAEIERSLAWQNRRLVFESAPLSEIVAEFNRYNHHKLVIADASLASRRFGGTFEANDPKTFLELIRCSDGVAVEARGDETVLRRNR